jgi:hypothetical protein
LGRENDFNLFYAADAFEAILRFLEKEVIRKSHYVEREWNNLLSSVVHTEFMINLMGKKFYAACLIKLR